MTLPDRLREWVERVDTANRSTDSYPSAKWAELASLAVELADVLRPMLSSVEIDSRDQRL